LKQDHDPSAKRIRPKLATHFFCFLLAWLAFFSKLSLDGTKCYRACTEKGPGGI
jgi:hypothetical protein